MAFHSRSACGDVKDLRVRGDDVGAEMIGCAPIGLEQFGLAKPSLMAAMEGVQLSRRFLTAVPNTIGGALKRAGNTGWE